MDFSVEVKQKTTNGGNRKLSIEVRVNKSMCTTSTDSTEQQPVTSIFGFTLLFSDAAAAVFIKTLCSIIKLKQILLAAS